MPETILLSLGSNVGDKVAYLHEAISGIEQFATVKKVSSLYQTAAWGNTEQDDFINLGLAVTTDLDPSVFLTHTKALEIALGRKKRAKWEPREIDIDIIFWNQEVINLPELQIPHPFWHERAFVLIPLAEVAPEFIPPKETQNLQTLTAMLPPEVWNEIQKKSPDKFRKI